MQAPTLNWKFKANSTCMSDSPWPRTSGLIHFVTIQSLINTMEHIKAENTVLISSSNLSKTIKRDTIFSIGS